MTFLWPVNWSWNYAPAKIHKLLLQGRVLWVRVGHRSLQRSWYVLLLNLNKASCGGTLGAWLLSGDCFNTEKKNKGHYYSFGLHNLACSSLKSSSADSFWITKPSWKDYCSWRDLWKVWMIAMFSKNKQSVSSASGFLLRAQLKLLISHFKVLQRQAHLVSDYDTVRLLCMRAHHL